jgi:hypothetical protein
MLLMHVAQFVRDQGACPAREPGRRWTLQDGQDTPTGFGRVFGRRAGARLIIQARKALPRKAATPLADRPWHRADLPGDRSRRTPFGSQQDDLRAQDIALFGRRRSYASHKHRTSLRLQPDFHSFQNHPTLESRIKLL